ncbi:retrovirus-related pol polyprotein from transposon TNT 1-94 [Tanacetum coccineum]|uniref:Retrovirus-related pol polyprotein from transposon TNT 1-94 n=1 Tax=Tanacetum coccineum TaxID=301880 RepID=A0ABQ5F8D4_9ASTR
MKISHQQSLAYVGSKNRSLMLKKGSYVPWVSCFMRYIDEKSDPIVQPHKRPQKEEDLTGDDKQLFEADIDEKYYILLGIPTTFIILWLHAKLPRQYGIAKYVTIVRVTHNLHVVLYDILYDFLKQNEVNVNNSRAKQATKAHDPLALVANTFASPSHPQSSLAYYVTHPSFVNDFDDDTQSYAYQGKTQSDDQEDKLTILMFNGRVDVQTKNMGNNGSAGRNTGHNFESSETAAYVQKANGNTTTVKRVPRINSNSGYTPTVQCYNCSENGHYSRECPKPRMVANDSDAEPPYDSDFVNEVKDPSFSFLEGLFSNSDYEQSHHE